MATILQLVASYPGVAIVHSDGIPIPVAAWALLDDGEVRPLYHAYGSSALTVWDSDERFLGYTFDGGQTVL